MFGNACCWSGDNHYWLGMIASGRGWQFRAAATMSGNKWLHHKTLHLNRRPCICRSQVATWRKHTRHAIGDAALREFAKMRCTLCFAPTGNLPACAGDARSMRDYLLRGSMPQLLRFQRAEIISLELSKTGYWYKVFKRKS